MTPPTLDDSPFADSDGAPDLTERVTGAVVDSFYSELVQGGRLAKERAQQMLAAVTVLLAALIAALVAGGIDSASVTTKVAVVASVLAWVVVGGLLAWAAHPPRPDPYPEQAVPRVVVQWALNTSATLEQSVESRLRRAIVATVAALVVTLVGFSLHLLDSSEADWRGAELVYVSGSAPQFCNPSGASATFVDTRSILEESVRLKVTCADGSIAEWFINRQEVLAIKSS